ncbi:MAG: PDDEXK nuclease domain-containing protein [Propionibacteriaceae bacterium]|nr:PDDEXK nuclease domain-containing protein [Propionibacteriaceae bacterium]
MAELTRLPANAPSGGDGLFKQAACLIDDARSAIAYHANTVQVVMYWQLGKLIDTAILDQGRADYGKHIVATLSRKLTGRYGSGFDTGSLRRMVQFVRECPEETLSTLPPQVGWSHVKELLPLKEPEAWRFYLGEVADKRLGVRELRWAISRKAFERRQIANSQIPEGSAVPLDTFRDPMLLDMLGLTDAYLEADLEEAILRELEKFLLEVGRGFAFVGRQVRMPMGTKDYRLDLLFYSRPLSRLVAVELKIGEFTPEYEGQMRFYLKWLDKYERGENEQAPIGLILCTSADREQVELMELHKDNIVVAEYWTDLLPKKELEARLQVMLRDVQERVARRALPGSRDTHLTQGVEVLAAQRVMTRTT